MNVLADYWQTLTDPAHLLTELTVEGLTALPGLIVGRVWLKRHDKKQHPSHEEETK